MQKAKWLGLLAIGALLGSYGPAGAAPAAQNTAPLTLSGCVIAGNARDSYLLTNVIVEGTAPPRAFYRFNTAERLKDYVGRRVEVKGKADLTDVDTGRVRVKTQDGKETTEVSSERRTVKVDEALFGTVGATKVDAEVATYKFEVESVKLLQGNCANAATAVAPVP